ncbi:trans-aconitate 2-methyltransferase [Nocardia otitidiscaviarum]|uniref:Trans-aconitate 2-methyltransferase n=1 Tax=Nocardia otitidiscaviarum TaxID=1823 RepID=A0A379JLY1_9NOCA|nr:class I SAM-dependent methyltransferase [Nocardia otitidiscaviarum]SUD49440.1 trans-aconitate 2-methyltransferase [Nocardia otitidiscaviarum]
MTWEAWQRSWDRQQELYLPDREERFRVMLDVVEAVAGKSPRVLDLACGTGTISRRLFARLPEATSVAVDRDPTLLAMARGSFQGDSRITFATADLERPGWTDACASGAFDAVLTATALHWMQPDPLRRLFTDLRPLLRPGGVFVNADHMPDPETPLLNAIDETIQHAHQERARADGARDWDQWWADVAADPALADEYAASRAIFDGREPGVPQPLDWHLAGLREAGFAEAGVAWRSITDAVVVAVR